MFAKRLYETGTVVGTDPEDLEGALVFGELSEVFLGEGLFDGLFIGGIDEGNAGAFETGTRETTTIDTGETAHNLVDGDEFGRAALVVVDAGLAGVEGKFAEEFEIAGLPGGHALTHTTVLRIEMLRATGKTGWHGDAGLLERGLGDVAQEGLVEGLQRLVGIGEHVPRGGLALVDAEVIVAVDEGAGEAGEENANLEIGHVGVALDDAPFVGVAIEEEQAILFAQSDTGLIEQTIAETDIFALGLRGYLDDLEGLEGDVVGFGEGHDVGNEDCGRGGETSDGEGTLDDTGDASSQFETFFEGIFGSPGIVAPMALADL